MTDGNGIEASSGGRSLRIGGPLAIVAIFALVVLVGLGRLWDRTQTSHERGHAEIVRAIDRLGCLVTMSADLRATVRKNVRDVEELERVCAWIKYPDVEP